MSKGPRVTSTTRDHAYDEVVVAEVEYAAKNGVEIPDGVALAIAAGWQSSGPVGKYFAELSTTGSVDVEELLEEIHRHRILYHMSPEDNQMMDLLATWALNHPSRDESA